MRKCILILSLSAFLLGCPARKIDLPELSDYHCLDDTAAASLDARLNASSLQAFRASYRLEISQSIERHVLTQAVVFEPMDNLRIDTFGSSLKTLLSLLTAKEGEFVALNVESKQAYQGSASPENLSLLTRLPLGVVEYASFLLGRPLLDSSSLVPQSGENGIGAWYLQRGQAEQFAIRERDFRGRSLLSFFRIESSPNRENFMQSDFLQLEYPLEDGKTERIRIRYSWSPDLLGKKPESDAQSSGCPGLVPQQIRFHFQESGLSGSLICESFELSPPLDDLRERLFKLRVPNGSEYQLQVLP